MAEYINDNPTYLKKLQAWIQKNQWFYLTNVYLLNLYLLNLFLTIYILKMKKSEGIVVHEL